MNNNLWHLILIDNNQNRYISQEVGYINQWKWHISQLKDCEGVIRKISNKMIYNDSFLISLQYKQYLPVLTIFKRLQVISFIDMNDYSRQIFAV